MSDIAQEFGIVEQGRMMRNFLHRFTRKAPLLSEYASGPRALVNLKTGERVIEATAEQAADEQLAQAEVRARVEKRTRELVEEAVERRARMEAERRIETLAPVVAPAVRVVLAAASAATGVSTVELMGHRRHRGVAYARWLAFFLLNTIRPDLSIKSIGDALNKDHSTVLSGLERFDEMRSQEPFAGWLAHDAVAQLMKSGGTP